MFFLLLSPQRVLVQGQNRTGRLYSSGTRSRKRRRARWHFCWLHRLVPDTFLVQDRTYSDRREPHFSYSPQSCAAFKHWFSPFNCIREEAGGWKNGVNLIRKSYGTMENGIRDNGDVVQMNTPNIIYSCFMSCISMKMF